MISSRLRPGAISLPQAFLEAAAGVLPAVALTILLRAVGLTTFTIGLLLVLEWLWLGAWPAWRLRAPGARRWWLRIPVGLMRLGVLAVALVGLDAGVESLQRLPVDVSLRGEASALCVAAFLLLFRVLFAAAIAISRPVRRRLRWQLMASHAGVIVLTIVALTASGSLVAIALVLYGVQPDAPAMAQSVATELEVAHTVVPLDRARTLQVIDKAASGRLALNGQPPLAGIIPHYPHPGPIIVEAPNGQILAASPHAATELRQYPDQLPVLARLRHLALAGHAADLRPVGSLREGALIFAAAPVHASDGRIAAVVLLQASADIPITPSRFFQGAVALFGVATVVLILISALPLLGLSFLFSYFLARSLTRRLEAVSRVATAIAAGNLTERAAMQDRNEVGRLAGDINRMADHLETTIGQLEQARTQAEEALRLRQQLVASVSHELRTPLAVVRAHLDALLMWQPVASTPAPPRNVEVAVPASTLEAVTAEIGRLESLVDDLFTLSRAQSDAIEVHCEPTDIAGLVGEVAALLRPLAQRERAVSLTVEAPPGLPRAVADGDRLRQILANLVRNAVRHTPEGGIIALSVTAEAEWIVIAVADTGEGIAPEHLPYIFERFYRADEARTRTGGGAGLGLAIVREFAELMGGRVTVESVPGEGTCFRVYLPRERNGPDRA